MGDKSNVHPEVEADINTVMTDAVTFHREMKPGTVWPGTGCPVGEENTAFIPASI